MQFKGNHRPQNVQEVYGSYYSPLVRQATLLVRDTATAEDVVQDVFATLQVSSDRLLSTDNAAAYLRRCVTNRARSVLRHRQVMERHSPAPAPPAPSAEDNALMLLERSSVLRALGQLAPRQRQALALRYYAGLSEAQIAASMGISQGAVKSHSARGHATLRALLQTQAVTPA